MTFELDTKPAFGFLVTELSSGVIGTQCDGNERSEIHALGSEITPQSTVYALRDGRCTSEPVSSERRYFEGAALLPANSFVAADDQVMRGSGRLGDVRRVAEDGSWETIELSDLEYESPCDAHITTDGVTRCVPRSRYDMNSGDRSDSGCNNLVGYTYACSTLAELMVQRYSASECESRYRLFQPGKPYSGKLYYPWQGGCIDHGNTDWGATVPAYFGTGPELNPERFPKVERSLLGGRLQVAYLLTDGAARLALDSHPQLHDAERDEDCSIEESSDGVLRCLPLGEVTGTSLVFSDSSCSEPLVRENLGALSCSTARRYLRLGARVLPIEAEVAGKQLYELDSSGKCRPTFSGETTIRQLGSEVPPHEFASVQRIVD
jgi:hypothetical protein